MASFYEKRILPKIIHCVCGISPVMRQRAKVVPQAAGHVLEIGVGSGLNLSYYNSDSVKHLTLIDPTPAYAKLQESIDQSDIPAEFLAIGAESLPMEDGTYDTVVATYTFCTIPLIEQSLQQVRRVLKPSGKLLFVEHGLAPDASVRKVQNRINPLWKRIAGGCHLNRDIPETIRNAGFTVSDAEQMYLPGWKPATYNVWGVARIG
jgi:ubiquinone/menaquinone biosynthesis C-methylase UbiE